MHIIHKYKKYSLNFSFRNVSPWRKPHVTRDGDDVTLVSPRVLGQHKRKASVYAYLQARAILRTLTL